MIAQEPQGACRHSGLLFWSFPSVAFFAGIAQRRSLLRKPARVKAGSAMTESSALARTKAGSRWSIRNPGTQEEDKFLGWRLTAYSWFPGFLIVIFAPRREPRSSAFGGGLAALGKPGLQADVHEAEFLVRKGSSSFLAVLGAPCLRR